MFWSIISVYLFAATGLTSYFAAYASTRQRELDYAKYIVILSVCMTIYLLGYLMEINSSTLEQMMRWNQVQNLAIPFLLPLWCTMVILLTSHAQFLRKWTWLLLYAVPTVSFFMRITNPYHHLYYKAMEVQNTLGSPVLYLDKGLWYFVSASFNTCVMIASVVLLYTRFKKCSVTERKMIKFLFLTSALPFMGLLLIVAAPDSGLDYAAILAPISLLLLMRAVHRYNFLEVGKLVRDDIFDNSSDGLLILDMENRILDFNKSARWFFADCGIALGKNPLENQLISREDLSNAFMQELPAALQLETPTGLRHFTVLSNFIPDASGKNIGVLKTIRDVSNERRLLDELHYLATTDELSGLPNFRQFQVRAEAQFKSARSLNQSFYVFLMDLDHFKWVNDSAGHAAGDDAIRRVGKRMREYFTGQGRFCGRTGGDEFTAVLVDADISEVTDFAEVLRIALHDEQMAWKDRCISLTISIGIACLNEETQSFAEVQKLADEALYEAKAAGRDCVVLRC